jgi:uncharacterized membrane protein
MLFVIFIEQLSVAIPIDLAVLIPVGVVGSTRWRRIRRRRSSSSSSSSSSSGGGGGGSSSNKSTKELRLAIQHLRKSTNYGIVTLY